MTNTSTLKITPYVPWLSVYSITAGTLYLWGYWSKFNVNILEYIGLMDLAIAAAFPLLSAVVGIVGGMILGQIFISGSLSQGGGKETPTGKFLNRYAILLLVIYLAIVLLVFPFLFSDDVRAFVLPLALMPLISFSIYIEQQFSFRRN